MEPSIYDLQDNNALYEVLGVPRTATDKDIRRAYLKLVVLYHPDKNPDGEEIFKEICFAHGVLSDPQQRAMYDNKSLRQNLQGRTKEYDPSMDPNVQLSPEDLRKFVEKLESAHAEKRQQQSQFERLREEEMQRRAEYDSKNPAFKAQYELERRQRQTQAAGATFGQRAATATSTPSPSTACTVTSTTAPSTTPGGLAIGSTLKGYRTSAELTAVLEEEERMRLYGVPVSSSGVGKPATDTPSAAFPTASRLSVRQQMLSKYRAEQAVPSASQGGTAHSRSSGMPGHARSTRLDFVDDQGRSDLYSQTVEEALRTYSHFDYLDYVATGRRDREPIAGAVIADALDAYVRKTEDPRALD